MEKSSVDRVHAELRKMAANFVFKPGEKLNESQLAQRLGSSRTPLREALNRLVAEGFLTFQPGKGFSCRTLSPDDILHLYELRVAIECEALRHSALRADESRIEALSAYLDAIEPAYETCRDPYALLQMDETFHLDLAALSGNPEFVRTLANVNGRIRYVRMIDLKTMRERPAAETDAAVRLTAHRRILDGLRARDAPAALTALRTHIERRREQTTIAVRNAYAQIYVDAAP